MLKKLLTLVLAIFILTTLPVVSFAEHSETVLDDTFIITQMKFMADNDYVLDNVTNEVLKVRLEVTNLCPQEENTLNIIITAKDKKSKKILIVNSASQTFKMGDTTKTVDIPFDLTDSNIDVDNINVCFYIWQNGNIKPLSRDLIINSSTDLKANSILYRSYGIYKLEGIVKANSKFSLMDTEPTQKGYVTAQIYDDFDCPDTSLAIKANAVTRTHTFEVGATNAEDLIGYPAIFYVKLNESQKYEIVAVKPLTNAVSTLEINASDLDDDSLCFNDSKPYFRYYKEGATSSTKVSLDADYVAVWNNTPATKAQLARVLDSSVAATIELIDSSNDGYFDIVKVYEYAHLIAEEVKADKGVIETYNGIKVDFDIENEDANVTIKDVAGNELAIEDIEAGDVLAIMVANGTFRPSINLVKTANYDSLEITVLKDSFVEGKVTEFTPTYDDWGYGYLSALKIAINGVKYDVAVNDAGIYNENKIDLQAEGTFYIGTTGKIVGFEKLYVPPNYGLIMSAYTSSNKSVAPQLTILTKDGKEVTFDVASSLRVVGSNGKYQKIDVKDVIGTTIDTAIDGTAWENLFDTTKTFRNELYTAFGAELDEIASADQKDEVIARFVTYKLNANNEIVEITPAVDGANEDLELAYDETTGKVAYNAGGQKLGKYLLADDAVVFDVDFINPTSSKVSDVSYFVDDSEYEALLYSKDDEGYYGAAVILSSDAVFKKGDGLAIVKSKTFVLNENDETVTKVVAYKNGEEVELIFDDNEYIEVYSNVAPEEFAVGTVLMYNADASGVVSKYAVVGSTTIGSTKDFAFDEDFADNFGVDYEDGDAFYVGWIYNKTSDNKNVFVMVTDAVSNKYIDVTDELFTVSYANQYTITGTKTNPSITLGTYTGGNVKKAYYDTNNNVIGYYVLVKTYKNEVTDIISFDDNGQIIDTDIELKNNEVEVERNTNYGLIMSAYTSTNKSVAPQLTVLTKDGEEVTFDVASSVRIVNPNTGEYIKVDVKDVIGSSINYAIDGTTWKNLFDTTKTFRNELYNVFGAELDEISYSDQVYEVKARFVTYKLNANNEIVEITPASTLSASKVNVELGFDTTSGKVAYNARGQKLGKYLLSDDAIVFDVDFINPKNSIVSDTSYFVDDSEYEVLLYAKDNEGYYGAAVILSSDVVFREGNGVAIVNSKSYTIDENDQTLVKITAYQNGEEVELIFDDNKYVEVYSNVSPEDFSLGTVFMYNANANNYVTKYAVVGTTSIGSTKDFAFDEDFVENYAADYKDGEAFYFGWISDKTRNDANLTVMVTDAISDKEIDEDGEMFTVANANQYTITGTRANPSIKTGTYTYGNVDAYDYDNDKAWFVLVRTFEEEVIDIISLDDNGKAAPVVEEEEEVPSDAPDEEWYEDGTPVGA